MNFWDSIKTFFSNLGHTIFADILTALPEIKQVALQAFSALIDAAIAYVEAKYGTTTAVADISPESKISSDNQKRADAINYIRSEVTKNPSAYPAISDSLLNFGIESRYQLKLTLAKVNIS